MYRVKLYPPFSDLAKVEIVEIKDKELENLEDLLIYLVELFPELAKSIPGNIKGEFLGNYLMALNNGKIIELQEPMEFGEVTIMSPPMGG